MPDTPSSNALPAGCADPVFGPTTTLPGLSAPFSLFRDQLGMAHVKTSNENDAFFAQGFVTAADRLFQMDVARRRALGRLSELLGDKFVNEDILIRKMGVPESCVADWLHTRQISDAERMILSYTAGVNAFITWGRTNTWSVEYSELNVEPEEWKPEDCIAASKARHALLGVFQNKLFRAKLAASLPREIFEKLCDAPRKETGSTILSSGTDGSSSGPEAPAWFATLDSVPEFSDAIQTALQSIIEVAGTEPAPGGSNIWNLAGQHTSVSFPRAVCRVEADTKGKVGNLLSGDPHRETECPNMWVFKRVAEERGDERTRTKRREKFSLGVVGMDARLGLCGLLELCGYLGLRCLFG